jgi:hypothetical protein
MIDRFHRGRPHAGDGVCGRIHELYGRGSIVLHCAGRDPITRQDKAPVRILEFMSPEGRARLKARPPMKRRTLSTHAFSSARPVPWNRNGFQSSLVIRAQLSRKSYARDPNLSSVPMPESLSGANSRIGTQP